MAEDDGPVQDGPQEAAEPATEKTDTPQVLVVDDEPGIRDVVPRILGAAGIPCLLASTGKEGGRLLNEHADRIAAVLLDMSLPDMSCREAYELLQAIRPGTPVIICTGWMQDLDLVEEHHLRVLDKPLDWDLLIETVRETLNPPKPPE